MTNDDLFKEMTRSVRRAFNAGFKAGMMPLSQVHPKSSKWLAWQYFCRTKMCRRCGRTYRDSARHYCNWI